jgi:hypothetical protein
MIAAVDLASAIEGLYVAFARYPLRARIEGCPHCDLGGNERSLHAAPLRELGADDFDRYPFKAMTTFGDVDDFRHFLPRIAELLTAVGAIGATDLGIFAGKMIYGEWTTWPERERDAVLTWLDALERAYLHDDVGRVYACDLLDANVALRGDATGFLSRWPDATGARALEELAAEIVAIGAASNRGETSRTHALVAMRPALDAALQRAVAAGLDAWELDAARDVLAFPPFAD